MRPSDAIFDDVEWLVFTEMGATMDFRRARSSEADRQVLEARADLLPLLREAAGLRNIDLLLDIERTFMELELMHIAHARKNISSLNAGIRQIAAASAMLGYVRNPEVYRWAGVFYTLSEDLVRDLPKDAAQKFFGSHRTRLGNVETGPLEASQTALLDARSDNMRLARDLYEELQRQALATSEVREPRPAGWTSGDAGVTANPRPIPETHDPAKPYIPERKHQRAA